ncbi:hypothetical protein ALP22_200032 [Pseudomonas coronafaciens pv. porri]|nr:hypothetical protein ALP22_200032 [Pseudomonas coronafaciens pv. porri]
MCRRYRAEYWTVPACQRLESHCFACTAFNDRLKQNVKLRLQIRPPQCLLGYAIGTKLFTVTGRKQASGPGVVILALVKGVIGIFKQLGSIVGGSWIRCETQSRADLDRYFREFETFMHQRAKVLAEHQ